MNLSSSIEVEIRALVEDLGFEQVGITNLTTPLTIGFYDSWLSAGFHGEMEYLRNHADIKREPSRLLKSAQNAIVVTKNYVPHPEPADLPLESKAHIARYARGRDYHHFLKRDLTRAIEALREKFPAEEFLCFTDSAPVLERDLARRSGLGWVGKNTCLLSQTEGSLFFIAEIYTTLEIPHAALEAHDLCGTCTRCLDACPTNALVAPRTLDARKCISYLTIEARTVPPESIREKIGDWLFGCDICQTVCPWNLKVGRVAHRPVTEPKSPRESLLRDLEFLLGSSGRAVEKAFKGTALSRAGGFGLKRNALIVSGNIRAFELKSLVETYVDHPKLGELARWTLEKIASPQTDERP